MDITKRIERWYYRAKASGKDLKHIAIHPSDINAAPKSFKGLPVVALNDITV